MLCAILAVIAAVCFIGVCIAVSVAIRLSERLEAYRSQVEETPKSQQAQHTSTPPVLWRVK
jgi:hypothetical protein